MPKLSADVTSGSPWYNHTSYLLTSSIWHCIKHIASNTMLRTLWLEYIAWNTLLRTHCFEHNASNTLLRIHCSEHIASNTMLPIQSRQRFILEIPQSRFEFCFRIKFEYCFTVMSILYVWRSLGTLYLHACHVRVTVGESGLGCRACVAYFER